MKLTFDHLEVEVADVSTTTAAEDLTDEQIDAVGARIAEVAKSIAVGQARAKREHARAEKTKKKE